MTLNMESPEPVAASPGPSSGSTNSSTKGSARGPALWVIADLHQMTIEALKGLALMNGDDPFVFRHGSDHVRLRTDLGGPMLEPLNRDTLRQVMATGTTWWKKEQRREGPVDVQVWPPPTVMVNMLATPAWPVREVERIVEVPVFSADGAVQITPGYQPGSRTIYWPPPGFTVPQIPANPTAQQLSAARFLVTGDLLGVFPFVGQADRAHAVAGLLLPFYRAMFSGPTPMHLISAPTRGSGKTLLGKAMALPAAGARLPTQSEAKDEEEWRKRIGAVLGAGPVAVFFDNLLGRLGSAALAAVLTAETWEDRLLGKTAIIRYPNQALWIATANNLLLSDEMVRRTLPIRIDTGMEKPYERDTTHFRHPHLLRWAAEKRPTLVQAALVLVSAWVAAGRPEGNRTMGSYEGWATVTGGLLEVAGINGFLDNLDEFRTEFDSESAEWAGLLTALHAQFGSRPFGAGEALRVYEKGDDFLGLGITVWGTDRGYETRLGHRLWNRRGAVFGGLRLEYAGKEHGGNRYRLIPVSGREPDEPSEPQPPTPSPGSTQMTLSPDVGSA